MPLRRNIQETTKRVLPTVPTLTGHEIRLHMAPGFERLHTEYRHLAEPLRALPIGNDDLSELALTYRDSKVQISGKRETGSRSGKHVGTLSLMGSLYADMLAATCKPLGLDIDLTETVDHATTEFRMTVPTIERNVHALQGGHLQPSGANAITCVFSDRGFELLVHSWPRAAISRRKASQSSWPRHEIAAIRAKDLLDAGIIAAW